MKPTLGYPSRTAAVLALSALGTSRREIARRIGIEESTVAALEHSARRSLDPERRRADATMRTVVFPVEILDRLRAHAAARRCSANELCRRIVETALDDGLIDAILDDVQ